MAQHCHPIVVVARLAHLVQCLYGGPEALPAPLPCCLRASPGAKLRAAHSFSNGGWDLEAFLCPSAPLGTLPQIRLLMEMLRAEPWCYFPLTVQFLSSRVSAERGRCPAPPPHMPVLVAPLEVSRSVPPAPFALPAPVAGQGFIGRLGW